MKKIKYKVASLFCWCWGADLGLQWWFTFLKKKYEQLPITINFAVDNDISAIETYNANFHHKGILKSVVDCKNEDIPDVDILVGWFPCQSFSTVNPNKDPFDERGQLYMEMARILNVKKPIAFVAENVKGLMVLKSWEIFKSVLQSFENEGYELSYKLLNAADFWVPQKRQRVFIVWIRKDLNIKFKFPPSTHHDSQENWVQKWIPLKSVIDDLVLWDDKYYFSSRAVQWMKNAKNNMKRWLYQDLSKPCLTVTSHLAKVSLNSRDPVLLVDESRELYRRFTPLEAARIQSFPDSFNFVWSEAKAYKQIGNAIPPILMWNIANSLINQLNGNYDNDRQANLINLNNILKHKNKSLHQLHKDTWISYQQLWSIANNKTNVINFDLLEKICKNLECKPNDIININ